MGFKLEIDGQEYQTVSFSVQESATPLSAGDSSGSVGTITFEIPAPDPEITPNHPIVIFGPAYLTSKSVRLSDSLKGFTLGKVQSVQRNRGSAIISVTALSRLGSLSVFNVQSAPFVGTLSDAFESYLSLANITSDFYVDPSIATTPVVFPGWSGELWYHLKQLAVAIGCEISLVSGVILLRPLRTREAIQARDIQRSYSLGGGTLAQSVEVYQYNNRPITDQLVYPPGGWSESVTVLNVNAGETISEPLELSASVASIQQPVMQTFVSQDYDSSSVFTVVGDDGLPVPVAAWNDHGGNLSVEINPDTTSLTVTITAPTGIPNASGEEIQTYGISLSSDSSTGRYSTLRIVGSGVAFDKQKVRIPTGLSSSETATEVGVTIDNPFLSERSEVYSAGLRAVRSYNGSALSVSGTVSAINQLGDSGSISLRSYAYVQTMHAGQTYGDVQALYSGMSYLDAQNQINAGVEDEAENQSFGNVGGSRVWDNESRRWYRIRSGTLSPGSISFEAEDDLNHSDVQSFLQGNTYDDIQVRYTGRTYGEVDLMGLR